MNTPVRKKIVVVSRKPTPPQKGTGAFGSVGTIEPITPVRKSLILRCVDIIISDIRKKMDGVKDDVDILTDEPKAGWEDYQRFLELSRRK